MIRLLLDLAPQKTNEKLRAIISQSGAATDCPGPASTGFTGRTLDTIHNVQNSSYPSQPLFSIPTALFHRPGNPECSRAMMSVAV